MTKYRREIDGLRAVAVMPVILFHAGVDLFSGGFVGVDVFFVLSGYLITSILVEDLRNDRYSIARFYERRVRRIIPALFLVIAVTIVPSWVLMTPEQFKELGGSIVSIIVFCSNFFFWLQTDYFAGSAELKPFLHTWSLSVEEQFYVLYPPLLALIWRFRSTWVLPLLIAGTVASLGLSEWASRHVESANFFLAPTRAWELLIGAICACILSRREDGRAEPTDRMRDLLSLTGLGLILYAIFVFDDQMRFPGLSALVPVGGTALIVLYATPRTYVARLLSWRIFVGIGLISYSAYLWHQPLFALARLGSYTEPSAATMALLAILSLVLAAISWRYVEQPFRQAGRGVLPTRGRVFGILGAAAAVFAVVGVGIAVAVPATWLSLRNPVLMVQSTKRAYEPQVAYDACPGLPSSPAAECRRLGDGPRRIVIWGDSHANAMSSALTPIDGVSIYVIGQWGCPPIIGIARYDGFGNASNCDRIGMTDRYADYVRSLKPESVVLIARWTLYANGRHYGSRLQRDTYFITDGKTVEAGAASSREVMAAGLARTVDLLRGDGAKVFVVQQVPDLHDYSPRALLTLRTVPGAAIERWHASEAALLSQAVRHGATAIPTHDLFCSRGACNLRSGDLPRYIDDSHVTFYGAEPVVARIRATVGAGGSEAHALE